MLAQVSKARPVQNLRTTPPAMPSPTYGPSSCHTVTVDRSPRIEQFPDAPEWGRLRRDVTNWCEQTRLDLVVELTKYEQGSSDWETTMGAVEFCGEVPSILEKSPDWANLAFEIQPCVRIRKRFERH